MSAKEHEAVQGLCHHSSGKGQACSGGFVAGLEPFSLASINHLPGLCGRTVCGLSGLVAAVGNILAEPFHEVVVGSTSLGGDVSVVEQVGDDVHLVPAQHTGTAFGCSYKLEHAELQSREVPILQVGGDKAAGVVASEVLEGSPGSGARDQMLYSLGDQPQLADI